MAKLSIIYGIDETAFAAQVAADALGAPDSDAYSGSPKGAPRAKGNSNDAVVNDGDVKVDAKGQSMDSRAVSKGGHPVTAYKQSGRG